MSKSLRPSPTLCVAKWKSLSKIAVPGLASLLGLFLLGACASPPTAPAQQAPQTADSAPAAQAGAPDKAASSSQGAHKKPPAAAGSAPAASSSSQANGNQKPFAEAIKGFTRIPGYLNVYRKDEQYLLELKESDFARNFLFTVQRTHGIGERGLWGEQMLESGVGSFVRLSDRVQWVERNTAFIAPHNAPIQAALAQSFSDSLRGAAAIVSQPEPQTKAILIDLNALVLSDFSATGTQLQAIYHQAYQFDRGNSLIQHIYAEDDETAISLREHFAAGNLAFGAPGQPAGPSTPGTLPDVRSMFFGFMVSFSALPDPAPVRVADPRVGYFLTTHLNYDDDLSPNNKIFLINRWRLEKKDPAAELSEPKKPIVYWLDKNIPTRYRDTVRRGILAWNTAFERAGFRNAIEVRQQPDDARWDTSERHYASVRWYLGTDNSTAIGPSLVDHRTGEILDADVIISDFWTRNPRTLAVDDLPHGHAGEPYCELAEGAFADLRETLDFLSAQGQIEPDSPEAEALVQDTLYWVVMHEIGHTLGLRHNFRASSAYSLAQLRDPAFVARNGLAASVMDYIPYNIPLQGQTATALTQKILGPYDYWAIEYGYTPFPADAEKTGLQKIAERATSDLVLAYGTDEDAGSDSPLAMGIDPAVARFDLGNDPLAWLQYQTQVSTEQWATLARRPPGGRPDEATRMRASLVRSFNRIGSAASNAARNIGGVRITRNTSPANREIFTPIPAATQRATLQALAKGLFQPASFRIDPALLRRVAGNPLDGGASLEPQVPLMTVIQQIQGNVLDQLFADRVSNRLLEGELSSSSKDRFALTELYATLRQDIWQELGHGQDIPLLRRNLQRAYLTRLSNQLLRPNGSTPADARALARFEAQKLQGQLQRALRQGGGNTETLAHLRESLATLDEVLRAPLLRQTP